MTKITWIGKNDDEVTFAARLLWHSISGYSGKHSLLVPSLEEDPSGSASVYHTLIDNNPIKYSDASKVSDFYFVLDESLLENIQIHLRESGILVVNTAVPGYQYRKHLRTHSINATGLAGSFTDGNSIAAALIGTFVALSGVLPYDAAVNGITDMFGDAAEKNIALFAVSYGIVLEGASL